MAGESRFNWEYDDGRDRLLALYQKGKDKQWDAVTRIDWGLEVDPYDALGIPDETIAIYGTQCWDKMSAATTARELRQHNAAWQFSQFLHGEQGAMICAARIVESVPDLDAKFYSATQTMDEARHAEIYARFLHEKIGMVYPINDDLQALLGDTLRDSRWDMPYLGHAGAHRGPGPGRLRHDPRHHHKPLPKQILAYVMQDEARHVAFGRMALRDYYRAAQRRRAARARGVRDRGLLPDARPAARRRGLENFGIPRAEAAELTERVGVPAAVHALLFSRHRAVRARTSGCGATRLQRAYVDMGVLDAGDANLELLMAPGRGDRREAGRRALRRRGGRAGPGGISGHRRRRGYRLTKVVLSRSCVSSHTGPAAGQTGCPSGCCAVARSPALGRSRRCRPDPRSSRPMSSGCVPTGVTTAAVPHANTSVISPSRQPSRHSRHRDRLLGGRDAQVRGQREQRVPRDAGQQRAGQRRRGDAGPWTPRRARRTCSCRPSPPPSGARRRPARRPGRSRAPAPRAGRRSPRRSCRPPWPRRCRPGPRGCSCRPARPTPGARRR